MSFPRFAIYFVPSPGSRLAAFGVGVLGYDCEAGLDAKRIGLAGIGKDEAVAMTGEPARYGFHATLKAPFVLAPGRTTDDLRKAMDSYAASRSPAAVGRLKVASLGSFLALTPEAVADQVNTLASECVEAFDAFRAPLSGSDRQRRLAGSPSSRQIELLDRWGYPYVFDQYRFHMTLTGLAPAERREVWRDALTKVYDDLADEEVVVDSIALTRQEDRGGKFRVVHRAHLLG